MKSFYSIILIIALFFPAKSSAQTNMLQTDNDIHIKPLDNQLFSNNYLQKRVNETRFVLDSMLQTNYIGNDSIVSKSYYKYNSEGKLIEKTDLNSDMQGNWHPQYKHEYIFDNIGIHLIFVYYQWNLNTKQWIGSNKSEYVFYPDGKLKEENSFSYDSTSMDWLNSMKKEIGYDENRRFKHDTTSVWIESKNSWQYYMNYESELDENDNILLRVSSVFEYLSENWAILDKVAFTYENEKRTKTESFGWSATLSQWEKWQVDEYFYDNNENEEAWVRTTWNDVLSDWFFDYKSEKEYNSNNQLILETNYKWEDENTNWVPVTSITWDYGSTGNIKAEVIQEWNTDKNDWQLRSTSEYFYSEFVTNINKNSVAFRDIQVYPNPANKTFTIESADHKVGNCHLYNSTGKLVKTLHLESGINTYNISELNSGIYFIRIPQRDGAVVKTLVKY